MNSSFTFVENKFDPVSKSHKLFVLKQKCLSTMVWKWYGWLSLYTAKKNTKITKQIFPEKEYRGLRPNFKIMRLWVIYILARSVHLFCWKKYVDRSWDYINRSQTHKSGNWGWGRAIPRKGIYKWDFRCNVGNGIHRLMQKILKKFCWKIQFKNRYMFRQCGIMSSQFYSHESIHLIERPEWDWRPRWSGRRHPVLRWTPPAAASRQHGWNRTCAWGWTISTRY